MQFDPQHPHNMAISSMIAIQLPQMTAIVAASDYSGHITLIQTGAPSRTFGGHCDLKENQKIQQLIKLPGE